MRRRKDGSMFNAVKYIFFFFNVLIWLLGCGVLALGIWMQVNKGPYVAILPSHSFLSATALCITVGAIILIVGFCGCCGALVESQCMLVAYFVFVFVIFGLEVAITVLGFSNKDQIRSTAEQELTYSIEHVTSPRIEKTHQEGVLAMIDTIQHDLQCCGMNNYTDWYTIGNLSKGDSIPSSCCIYKEENCGQSTSLRYYKRGCLKEIEYWFLQNMYVLGIVALLVGVVQISAMVAAVALFCCLRKDDYL
ncbi:tetraspanin-4-like [Argopecten irradians]|uniref:tetraspanin-4-like n=1 Tax=Argopecten irradians TaxID=31199 RepID=UPI0037193C33